MCRYGDYRDGISGVVFYSAPGSFQESAGEKRNTNWMFVYRHSGTRLLKDHEAQRGTEGNHLAGEPLGASITGIAQVRPGKAPQRGQARADEQLHCPTLRHLLEAYNPYCRVLSDDIHRERSIEQAPRSEGYTENIPNDKL
ncbi:hypothetical protein PROFUN_07278 [Planoprotostelium fungivorum]|uniref:Uncharacterized protein n=1 Tax=Planoprotostelium fungivorum TaxID=1890364 RepID=A0A2P6NLZ9_9EUKA|nr:hypothetical protein PROFUN_07278 [Planoprotostelium fungivorum]